MKKKGILSCLLTLGVVSSVMALTGCDSGNSKDSTPGGHVHSYETWTVLPSCQEMGYIEHLCACGDRYQSDYVSRLDHTIVIDQAVAPTCAQEGKTMGAHCSVCGTTIIAQEPVETTEHTEVVDKAIAPTCTENGLTAGKHCGVCGTVIVAQETVKANGHTYATEWSYNETHHWHEATCGCDVKDGYSQHTEDSGVCSICSKVVHPTEGVQYDLSNDGTYAVVVGYEGTETNVVIADTYQGVPVKRIGDHAFNGCSGLTRVVIPNGVISIGSSAFYNCSSLTSVVIGDGVTSIGNYAFSYCYGLTSIIVSEGNVCYQSIDGNLYNKDGTELLQYAIGKAEISFTIPDGVTTIGGSAFYDCSSLTSVVIPDSVTSIGGYAFAFCFSLTSVVIPDSVTSIGGGAFYGCSSLTSVVIPDGVTSIGDYAFYYCSSLTSVIIGGSVTSIGSSAFFGCYGLTSVNVTNR